MRRKSRTSETQASSLLDRITEVEIRDSAFDFSRIVGAPESGMTMADIPSEIRNRRAYRAVLAAMQMAYQAYGNGEFVKFNFLLGMAAAFYGLIRLIEANELDAKLASALGLTEGVAQPTQPMRSNAPNTNGKTFELRDLAAVLDADGIEYVLIHDSRALASFFGTISLIVHAIAETGCVYFLFGIPMSVRKHRRAEMALALTRANHGLNIGGFEMDLGNGRLSFKVSVPIDDACLTPGQMRRCLVASILTIDKYMQAFRRVLFEGVSAEEAIKAVES